MFSIKRSKLFEWYIPNKSVDNVFNNITKEHFVEPDAIPFIKRQISKTFVCQFNTRFCKSNRHLERFKQEHKTWLNTDFIFDINNATPEKANEPIKKNIGRPLKSYEDVSDRSKRRKRKDLIDSLPEEQLKKITKF